MKTNALCAVDNEIKRLEELPEKTHQRRSKVLRKRNDAETSVEYALSTLFCIDGRDYMK